MDNQPQQPVKEKSSRTAIIRNIYFYLVSFVALMMVVWSTADLINIALKTWVFTKADENYYEPYVPDCDSRSMAKPAIPGETPVTTTREECEKQKKEIEEREQKNKAVRNQNSIVRDISLIVVGMPLFLYHWKIIRKKEEKE